jgi:excisionase family DNA binding protein
MHQLITADEVARILRIKKHQVYAMVRKRMLPPGVVVRLGRLVRFDEDELRGWASAGGTLSQMPNEGGTYFQWSK